MAKDFMAAFLRERDQSESVSKLDTKPERIVLIPLDQVRANADNFYDTSSIADLVESIATHGIMSPITVCPDPFESKQYMIISGHRRTEAYRHLLESTSDEKYKQIPAIVKHPRDAIETEMMLIEGNATARVLSSYELMEQVKRYDDLLVRAKAEGYDYCGRRRDIVAKMASVSPSRVGRLSAINKNLDELWRYLFQTGKISESVAYEISKLDSHAQSDLLDVALDNSGNVNITNERVQQFVAQRALTDDSAEETDSEVGSVAPEPADPSADAHESTPAACRETAEEPDSAEAREFTLVQDPLPSNCESTSAPSSVEPTVDVPNEAEMSCYACIGRRLKNLREERGVTRSQMADLLGWYTGTYSAVENGGSTSIDRLCEVARKFDVSTDWLVGLSNNRNSKIRVLIQGIAVRAGRDRMTHKRVNGIKSGYWSAATKEDLVQRLAEYENAEEEEEEHG